MSHRWSVYAAVVVVTLSLSVAVLGAPQDDYQAGQTIGNAPANRAGVVNNIRSGSAATNQPSYNTNPPEKSAASGDMGAAAQTKKANCASTPNDPECAGMNIGTANRPKQTIAPSDPILSGEAVARDPRLVLNEIDKAYSTCRVGETNQTVERLPQDAHCRTEGSLYMHTKHLDRNDSKLILGRAIQRPRRDVRGRSV
jgi:hypothetical protein